MWWWVVDNTLYCMGLTQCKYSILLANTYIDLQCVNACRGKCLSTYISQMYVYEITNLRPKRDSALANRFL